jgi:hypothetical protein
VTALGQPTITVVEEKTTTIAVLPSPVSVAPPGHELRVSWAPAGGAQSADVTAGTLTVHPTTAVAALGTLSATSVDGGKAYQVTIPGGRRLRALTLTGLRVPGGAELRSESSLGDLRLVASIEIDGRWTPLCSVPPASGRGLLPQQLTGATYSNRIFKLPDPLAPRVRLALVKQSVPEEFEPQVMELGSVHGTAAVPTAELRLVGPDGAVAWEHPPELAAAQTADLRAPAALALDARLAAGEPPDVTFRLRGAPQMTAGVVVGAVRGALVRTWPGVLAAELAGAPAALELGAPALAAETPAGAVADVAIRYAGRRLHDAVRDAVPAAGTAAGPVVATDPVVRELPPAALRELPAANAAPIGRSPEGCELSVELVDLGAGPPGTPVAPPGVLAVPASEALAAHPVELPDAGPIDRPLGVALRATSGRFLWAAGADGAPLLRLAVHDPDPGGRPLRIGAATLRAVDAPELTLLRFALPAAALRGPAAPLLSSDLFLSVDLADLTVRYAR